MTLALPRPRPRGMTRRARRLWFFTLYVAGCASVATATGYAGYDAAAVRVPQAVQIVLGLLMVFVVPGWSLVCGAFPELESWGERLLASVGISVTVATCAAVLLAAAPIGFSRQPFGELLGGFAIVLSVGGLYRARLAAVVEELRAWMHAWMHAWVKKHSIGERRGTQRLTNSAKRQQDMETDVRRSEIVLKFSFDSKPDEPRA
jgi:hypothetical protein